MPDSFVIRTRLHGCMLFCFAWFIEFFNVNVYGFVALFYMGLVVVSPFVYLLMLYKNVHFVMCSYDEVLLISICRHCDCVNMRACSSCSWWLVYKSSDMMDHTWAMGPLIFCWSWQASPV